MSDWVALGLRINDAEGVQRTGSDGEVSYVSPSANPSTDHKERIGISEPQRFGVEDMEMNIMYK